MIYACDHCRFIFNRAGEVSVCPNCGKPAVREASKDEKEEYKRTLDKNTKIKQE